MPTAGAATPDTSPRTIDWQPLRLLTFYRAILAGLLTVLYFGLQDSNLFNVQLPEMFKATLLTYVAFSIIAGFSTRLRWPAYEFQALLQVLADIGAISLLMHASGGVISALSILLVIAVVTGALLLPGRLAYLFAAVATLAVLFETGVASLSVDGTGGGPEHITRAGLMGTAFFIAAALAHVLAIRAQESAALATQRGIDLANLEQLNRYVVRQLHTGLLVIDPDNIIHLANDTARTLLGIHDEPPVALEKTNPGLSTQLQHWKNDHHWQPAVMQTQGNSLIPRFSELTTSQGKGALILLEDSTELARQSQQLKLASLGRLTASIAHEIRNPLGAISHAAQLLEESDNINAGDKRLTEIIGNHTQRVNTIIENVLQLSRRSASRPQELPVKSWLQNFREEFTQTRTVASDHLLIDVEPDDLLLQVDPGQLHQVLTNLCDNAITHGGADTVVTLKARRGDIGVIRLEVIDNGPGIAPDEAAQLFEPFYTTASSGTGLGLYIARELCDINQAQLNYLSTAEGGSCFRIQFSTVQA